MLGNKTVKFSLGMIAVKPYMDIIRKRLESVKLAKRSMPGIF